MRSVPRRNAVGNYSASMCSRHVRGRTSKLFGHSQFPTVFVALGAAPLRGLQGCGFSYGASTNSRVTLTLNPHPLKFTKGVAPASTQTFWNSAPTFLILLQLFWSPTFFFHARDAQKRRRDAGATQSSAAFPFDRRQAREFQILGAFEFRDVDDLAGVIAEMFGYVKDRIQSGHEIALNFIFPRE
jgi:hypothetical protein